MESVEIFDKEKKVFRPVSLINLIKYSASGTWYGRIYINNIPTEGYLQYSLDKDGNPQIWVSKN